MGGSRLSGLSQGWKDKGRTPEQASRWSGAFMASGWAESGRLQKRGPEVTPGVQASPDHYLAAAAGGGGNGAWAGAGAAWMDRTPSGDSADVTVAGSTPAGKR